MSKCSFTLPLPHRLVVAWNRPFTAQQVRPAENLNCAPVTAALVAEEAGHKEVAELLTPSPR